MPKSFWDLLVDRIPRQAKPKRGTKEHAIHTMETAKAGSAQWVVAGLQIIIHQLVDRLEEEINDRYEREGLSETAYGQRRKERDLEYVERTRQSLGYRGPLDNAFVDLHRQLEPLADSLEREIDERYTYSERTDSPLAQQRKERDLFYVRLARDAAKQYKDYKAYDETKEQQ